MADELKPCPVPWCGGEATTWTEATYWTVPQKCPPRCAKCGCTAPDPETWNTRPAASVDVERAARAIYVEMILNGQEIGSESHLAAVFGDASEDGYREAGDSARRAAIAAMQEDV